jgi:hypothetical protein
LGAARCTALGHQMMLASKAITALAAKGKPRFV